MLLWMSKIKLGTFTYEYRFGFELGIFVRRLWRKQIIFGCESPFFPVMLRRNLSDKNSHHVLVSSCYVVGVLPWQLFYWAFYLLHLAVVFFRFCLRKTRSNLNGVLCNSNFLDHFDPKPEASFSFECSKNYIIWHEEVETKSLHYAIT